MAETKSGGNPMVRAPEALHPLIRELARVYRLGKGEQVRGALEQALASLSTGVITPVSSHDVATIADILTRLERVENILYSQLHTSDNNNVDRLESNLNTGDSGDTPILYTPSIDTGVLPTPDSETVDSDLPTLASRLVDMVLHTSDSSTVDTTVQAVEEILHTPASSASPVAATPKPEPVTPVVVKVKAGVVSTASDDDKWLLRGEAYEITVGRGYKGRIEGFAQGASAAKYQSLGFLIDTSRRQNPNPKARRWLVDVVSMKINNDIRFDKTLMLARLGLFSSNGYVDQNSKEAKENNINFGAWSQSRDHHGIAWKYEPDTRLFAPILD